MSKIIRMTPEQIETCVREFEETLRNSKLPNGKISYNKTLPDIPASLKRKAVLYYTPEAWSKMIALIFAFDVEVAWHGVAHRIEDSGLDEYLINDIVVYPQEVAAATVEMDPEEYTKWLMENIDDDRFDYLYAQGHSHVGMPVSPSTTDLDHQESILCQMKRDGFYIFSIWNKKFESNNKIYDLKKNVLFENSDISVKILDNDIGLEEFIKQAKDIVKKKIYTYTTPYYKGSQYTGSYQAHKNDFNGGAYPTPYNPVTPVKSTPAETPKGTTPAETKPASSATTGTPPKKDETDLSERKVTKIGAGWLGKDYQGSLFDTEKN